MCCITVTRDDLLETFKNTNIKDIKYWMTKGPVRKEAMKSQSVLFIDKNGDMELIKK